MYDRGCGYIGAMRCNYWIFLFSSPPLQQNTLYIGGDYIVCSFYLILNNNNLKSNNLRRKSLFYCALKMRERWN